MHEALEVVWGKSKAAESVHLLVGHLLDTAAVGELVWSHFLSPAIRNRLDECSDGRGRLLFCLLCGLHDVGKATPAFQSKDELLAQRVRAAGLDWSGLTAAQSRQWHHTKAGALIFRDHADDAGWSKAARNWVWPLIAGHHGRIPPTAQLRRPSPTVHGTGAWAEAQRAFVERVASDLGTDLSSLADVRAPTRASQLTLSGLIIVADWIASDEKDFGGQDNLSEISLDVSRGRARRAWERLGLCGGWKASQVAPTGVSDLVQYRFGKPARRAQADVVSLAERMRAPGLLIAEAPMGEGKTEAALVAAEVLARRFGADGVFVGMPTQATSDPMFSRVLKWRTAIDPHVPIGLLHGRARFNKEWAALRTAARFGEIHDGLDAYGMRDDFAWSETRPAGLPPLGEAAPEWFLGPKRGLLTPVTVGTVDHLLHAATRTKHVMLRQAGLAGRVVILDEVHAYDVYMAQFLFEALRWLADAGVPVILLSATLPPDLRMRLMRAYLQGATQQREPDMTSVKPASGYPCTSAIWVDQAGVVAAPPAVVGTSWRAPVAVQVDVLDETVEFMARTVADAVTAEVGGGGCALVVCNTVRRAQEVYAALRPTFGDDAILLHARFVAADRADRTTKVVGLLGPPDADDHQRPGRPKRLVLVATQVAEQSFDVDVDLLVSDLAPIDLLLQRVGRLHRHQRPEADRPARLCRPRLIVSGMAVGADGVACWPRGSRAVYGDHLLLRAAALVLAAKTDGGWSIPTDVPRLVAAGYGDDPVMPAGWSAVADRARREWEVDQRSRAAKAGDLLLSGEDRLGLRTLEGLHERDAEPLNDDDQVAAVVRDGEESVEVILVRRSPSGYLTLRGRPLGPNGEAVSDDGMLEEVAGSTIRLPANNRLTAAARAELGPLPGWSRDDPWLRRARALVLDGKLSVALGSHLLTYDDKLGLTHQDTGPR